MELNNRIIDYPDECNECGRFVTECSCAEDVYFKKCIENDEFPQGPY